MSLATLSGVVAAVHGCISGDPSLALAACATTMGTVHFDPNGEVDSSCLAHTGRDQLKMFKKLYAAAGKCGEDAQRQLTTMLATEAHAVGMLYDIWKEGDGAAQTLLQKIDITHHARQARLDPQEVYALSLLNSAGHADAQTAMREMEVLDIADQAKTNPHGVFALTHLMRAGNEAAQLMLARMGVEAIQRQATHNPFAVYALSHLTQAGHPAALDAMKNLRIEDLIERIDNDAHVARAINLLFGIGNVHAITSMISRIRNVDSEKLLDAIKGAIQDIGALTDIYQTIKGGGKETVDFLKVLDVSHISFNLSGLDAEKKWQAVDMLYQLASIGNEGVLDLLGSAARTNAWAVWLLDRLKTKFRPASIAMRNLDVAKYREPARGEPYMIFTLQLLAFEKNTGAVDIMKNLDVSELARQARSSTDPSIVYALAELSRTGNKNAVEALFQLADHNPRAETGLHELARGKGPDAEAIRKRLEAGK